MDAVNDNSYDYSLVALTEADIDDPRVHIDLGYMYDRDHLPSNGCNLGGTMN